MSKIEKLAQNYAKYISIPWKSDTPAPQRVIFCIYKETEERVFRLKIDEFKIATLEAKHDWELFDLTNTFPKWLCSQKYAESYFKHPELLSNLIHKYLDDLSIEFDRFLHEKQVNQNSVVALVGVGSLFGFLKVKDLVDRYAPLVKGRLLVFFPGSYENNNYRLLDGYDGWNYLAVPITSEKDY